MVSTLKILALVILWMGLMLAALSSAGWLPLDPAWNHRLCGPWGCYPPLPDLLAMHGFWFLAMLGPSLMIGLACQPDCATKAGWLALTLGLLGLLCVGVHVCLAWLPLIESGEPVYFGQRYAFVLFSKAIDLPIVPLTLAGLVLLGLGHWRGCRPTAPAI